MGGRGALLSPSLPQPPLPDLPSGLWIPFWICILLGYLCATSARSSFSSLLSTTMRIRLEVGGRRRALGGLVPVEVEAGAGLEGGEGDVVHGELYGAARPDLSHSMTLPTGQ